jgi:hypothetical protein
MARSHSHRADLVLSDNVTHSTTRRCGMPERCDRLNRHTKSDDERLDLDAHRVIALTAADCCQALGPPSAEKMRRFAGLTSCDRIRGCGFHGPLSPSCLAGFAIICCRKETPAIGRTMVKVTLLGVMTPVTWIKHRGRAAGSRRSGHLLGNVRTEARAGRREDPLRYPSVVALSRLASDS